MFSLITTCHQHDKTMNSQSADLFLQVSILSTFQKKREVTKLSSKHTPTASGALSHFVFRFEFHLGFHSEFQVEFPVWDPLWRVSSCKLIFRSSFQLRVDIQFEFQVVTLYSS